MKLFILSMVSFFAFQLASAQMQSPPIATRDLKAVMKDMGSRFKVLGPQIADPSKNPESIRLLKELGNLITEAESLRPDTIAALPASQQRASELRYLRLILELHVAAIDGEEALGANDQAAAQAALKHMADLKSQGHDEFKD